MKRADPFGTVDELSERIERIEERVRKLDFAIDSILMKAQLSDCLLVIKKVDEKKAKEMGNDETRTAV